MASSSVTNWTWRPCSARLQRGGDGLVAADAVEHQHVVLRLRRVGQHVPGAGAVLGTFQPARHVRQPAGGDDHGVRPLRQDFGLPRIGVEPHRDAQPRPAPPRATARSRSGPAARSRGWRASSWPPSLPAASNSTTAWPRSAATRAASSPAGPPPHHDHLAAGGGRTPHDLRQHALPARWPGYGYRTSSCTCSRTRLCRGGCAPPRRGRSC